MHDIKAIRENPNLFAEKIKSRGIESIDDLLLHEAGRRSLCNELGSLLAKRNELVKKAGKVRVSDPVAFRDYSNQSRDLKNEIERNEATLTRYEAEIFKILSSYPNLPADDVPDGLDERDNVLISEERTIKHLDNPRSHDDIGFELGMMDFETAANISGSRYVILKGKLAKLERVLGQFMLDALVNWFGYTEVSVPLIVNASALHGTGQLPKFKNDLFKIDGSESYLIPTAEVPLTNIEANWMHGHDQYPKSFAALTPCFRSEAGSSGKDTKGLIRQHQFYKVEMVKHCLPEQSNLLHLNMVSAAKLLLDTLDIPYRVMLLCKGDLGFSAKKTYDIEAWFPSQNKYREVSSISNCGDFQARRMNARYRDQNRKMQYLHTLNGSGLAVGRVLAAIMENYQTQNGDIEIPIALQNAMGCKAISLNEA